MSNIPKCSVVLANYNYERYLPKAIQSALDQDYPNVEVVVVDEELDFGTLSLYDELSSRWGVTLGTVSASVVASPPDPSDAELLGIDSSTPCLIITSASRTASGEVIEFGRSVYRSDRYDLTIDYRAT